MRVLFMGTPDFAAESLRALYGSGAEIVGVVTQPDKPKNRGMKVAETPVAEFAKEHGIAIYKPDTLRNGAIMPLLDELKPELIAVTAYGKLLPSYVLDYPKYGCINIHASLLPKYRGSSPIQQSIINGDKVTGVTSMYMAKALDTGDIILKKEIEIDKDDTAETLHDKLAALGGVLLVETIELIESGKVLRIPQDDEKASYAPMLSKEMGKICWDTTAEKIINLIRGLNPWPCAYSFVNGKRFKIYDAVLTEASGKAGEIIDVGDKSFTVAAAEGAVEIFEVQFDNKRRMSVSEFLRGNSVIIKGANLQ